MGGGGKEAAGSPRGKEGRGRDRSRDRDRDRDRSRDGRSSSDKGRADLDGANAEGAEGAAADAVIANLAAQFPNFTFVGTMPGIIRTGIAKQYFASLNDIMFDFRLYRVNSFYINFSSFFYS